MSVHRISCEPVILKRLMGLSLGGLQRAWLGFGRTRAAGTSVGMCSEVLTMQLLSGCGVLMHSSDVN